MHPTVTLVRIQAARDQLQLAANITAAFMTNNAPLLDRDQADRVAQAFELLTKTEEWLGVWQATVETQVSTLN